jgi:putative tricarboxylic transport membrane protein
VAILRTPFSILMPSIVFVCAIGAYAVNNRMVDIWYVVLFGAIGYVLKKLEYPLAPMVLALVLGDLAESAMRQSLIMSQGSLAIFLASPIAATVNGLAMLLFLLPVVKALRSWFRPEPATPTAKLQDVPAADR